MASPPDRTDPQQGRRSVVLVAGEIDLDTATRFRRSVDAVPDTVESLVIDLRDVSFMACAGLWVLLAARQRLGPRLHLRGPSPQVQRLLAAAGLDDDLVLEPAEPFEVPGAASAPATGRPMVGQRAGTDVP